MQKNNNVLSVILIDCKATMQKIKFLCTSLEEL